MIVLFCKYTFKVWWVVKHLGLGVGGMCQLSGMASLVFQVTKTSDYSLLQSYKGEEALGENACYKHNTEFRVCVHSDQ